MKKVAIGLSGGVDSSVAAALLVEQGYDVTGVYITCWSGPGCRSEEDRQDALDIALQLGIPFVHLDFQKEYREKVYEYMIREYTLGRTPNPDVMCNREIKFGLFYDWALTQGFDYVATGHYAQIGYRNQSSDFSVLTPFASESMRGSDDCARKNLDFCLLRSADEHKDQTYFLYQLHQEQLEHILFSIGHLTKPEVRAEAERRKLLSAKKPDSQGICFIGEVSVSKFLEERIEKKEGDIALLPSHFDSAILARHDGRAVDASQNALATIVGKHKGVWFYTVGQRIGNRGQGPENRKWENNLKMVGFDTTRLPHFYVVGKDMEQNILYIGTEEQLYTDTIILSEMHWIGEEKLDSEIVRSSGSLLARIRHTGELVPVEKITIKRSNYLTIKLTRPVWGVASGQMVVLYHETVCLGGGIIA